MYYLVFGILYLISLLPFPLLYLLSDFFYVVIFYLLGYRKKVVYGNLAIAFPDKTEDERKKIGKQFYKDFCDNWVECIKLLSISETTLKRRITSDAPIYDELHASGKSCYILLGHMFNWEWANNYFSVNGQYKVLCVYSPLSNEVVDRLFLRLRSRFGASPLPFNDMRKAMIPFRNQQYTLALMADQSPPIPDRSYWLNFFGRPTAFLAGTEKGARLGKMPIIYADLIKTGRGRYHFRMRLLTADAGLTEAGELTQKYVRALEENIREYPSGYLWSHRRWKLDWKPEYSRNWIDKDSSPVV